jgi:uncharacterized protein YbaA (DUF1428 family)
MASVGCKVWKEHGVLDYYECVGDVQESPFGISFSKLCTLKSDETVIFAFIIYKSKTHATQVNKKVFRDSRMSPEEFKVMPFDIVDVDF